MADAKLSILLDWVSSHVKDFPFNGPLVSDWQVVGQRPFDTTKDSCAETCGHLATWGTIMVAIKVNCVNGSHYAASEINFYEPSVPPDPIHNPEVNPYSAELPYPEINPSPMEMPYPDGNPCVVDPLSVEFWCHTWVQALSLPKMVTQ